jgi:hypothetical protein
MDKWLLKQHPCFFLLLVFSFFLSDHIFFFGEGRGVAWLLSVLHRLSFSRCRRRDVVVKVRCFPRLPVEFKKKKDKRNKNCRAGSIACFKGIWLVVELKAT